MSTSRRLAAGLALAVLASLASPVHVLASSRGTATGGPGLPCAEPLVADPVGGAAAINELGADLPEAAANIDHSPAEFRTLLRSDRTMRVDRCGQTFVVEPAMTVSQQVAAAAAEDVTISSANALDASGDAFTLNSRPGSLRTIFLDFDGALVAGTGWNTNYQVPDVQAPGFDKDSAPATFSAAERDTIRSVWLRVADDYAPFDVNVTTQDPGQAAITRTNSSDLQFGTRALITMDSVLWTAICSCGGVAWVGSFDSASPNDYYQPALVFQRGLGGAGASAKSIAEAAAHEVGHNLGLSHDGTATVGYYAGQGAWAPIMGVGYNQPVTQWSRGEYAGANNTEDDLTVVASNGVNPVVDDHAGATSVAYASPAADGLIGTRTDTDSFTFTVPAGAGLTTVQVTPQTVSADLDTSLTVRNSAGTVIAMVDPPVVRSSADQATGLGATYAQTLAAGTYTATVDGVGFGTSASTGYSDYASLGRYTISVGGLVTPPPPPPPPPATPFPAVWTGSLTAAVTKLTVRSEVAAGYSSARFPLVDADGDCRKIRAEVLKSESLAKVRWKNARHCVVVHGRWFSSFDRHTVKRASNTSVVWTVPLSEAWQSGANSWSTARRQHYANDLGDSRTLLAVTSTSAAIRANRAPTSWLPVSASRCTYLARWVAVKLRWGLAANSSEQARLASLAAGCAGTRLTVHRA